MENTESILEEYFFMKGQMRNYSPPMSEEDTAYIEYCRGYCEGVDHVMCLIHGITGWKKKKDGYGKTS